ncbi:unnamed protein product [Phytomonas sp. EM1]|nr:unnamed protein product [Phytomonas sp. EM1]|eukprot:CCW64739.1 unnamed protein product [Phytomonas sp. isolate EM1]
MLERSSSLDVEPFRISRRSLLTANIILSIGLIFINKEIFEEFGFPHALILTTIHFAFTLLVLIACRWLGIFKFRRLPIFEILLACLGFCAYVSLSNLSLMLNPV